MKRVNSPLRYPGGKARIAGLIAILLERNLLVGSHVCEPFAGGAAVSLALLANGFVSSATLIERDPLIYAFWAQVKRDPQRLIDMIEKRTVSMRNWKRLLPYRSVSTFEDKDLCELAYAGLFFNRTCFSGILGAGPIGGMKQTSDYAIDCRFNKAGLSKSILEVHSLLKKVDVFHKDGIAFLGDECRRVLPKHAFLYIDPPYVSNGHKLYRHFFSEARHKALATKVRGLEMPWLLSYDNHPLITSLYKSGQFSRISTYQTLRGSRVVDELLFMSPDFVAGTRDFKVNKRAGATLAAKELLLNL